MHEKAQAIFEMLRRFSSAGDVANMRDVPLYQGILAKLQAGERLEFILPAFPAKSPNPEKTSGALPDLGEVASLMALNRLCRDIGRLHAAGAHVVICSDGRVFADVVRVPDEDITRYQQEVEGIIKRFRLKHLSTFAMDDLHPELTGDELRAKLLAEHARPLDEIRAALSVDENQARMFNGMHRFITEDRLALDVGKSKNQVSKESKAATLELMRRSEAWSVLLKRHFPGALRLSIHPYPPGHEKFGIKLLPGSGKWGTPWHNVTVRTRRGLELMHRREALAMGARPRMLGGRYAYYAL